MLKLVKYLGNELRPSTRDADLYIMPVQIISLESEGSRTIVLTASRSWLVDHTLDEILAMPEMQYLLYPAMVVG
jgi:hypothetical protein